MISKDGYRYEVTNKVIFAWLDSQGLDESPCLRQDVKPNSGEPFASDAEATAWIEEFIRRANLPPVGVIPVEEGTPVDEPVAE